MRQEHVEELRTLLAGVKAVRYRLFLDGDESGFTYWVLDKIDDFTGDVEGRLYLHSMPYDKYLKTQHWRRLRAQATAMADDGCALCGREGAETMLHVHHRKYEHRGIEDLGHMIDLTVLCSGCHGKFHDKIKK